MEIPFFDRSPVSQYAIGNRDGGKLPRGIAGAFDNRWGPVDGGESSALIISRLLPFGSQMEQEQVRFEPALPWFSRTLHVERVLLFSINASKGINSSGRTERQPHRRNVLLVQDGGQVHR